MLRLVDTHCHIHEANYSLPADDVLARAKHAGVDRVICVGTDPQSSIDAVQFAKQHENVWAIVGVHPHEVKHGLGAIAQLLPDTKVVGIGEIGLDYFYDHSPRDVQIDILNRQIELAIKHDLPISFHVREAFDDFWSIFNNFSNISGVLHSYTDTISNMETALSQGLFIGINGIATFNKDAVQREMYRSVPLESTLLETDAPFLTPVPMRGTVNEPAFVVNVAKYLSDLHNRPIEQIAEITTNNAQKLFSLK